MEERSVRFLGLVCVLVGVGCGQRVSEPDRGAAPPPGVTASSSSPTADARLEVLRTRFRVPGPTTSDLVAPRTAAAIGDGLAHLVRMETAIRAEVPPDVRRRVLRPAEVLLPLRASGIVRVEDTLSHLSIGVRLEGATDAAAATTSDGLAVYSDALPGHDLIHRPHADGTEDYVVFETKPAVEALEYEVDVSAVAGLRLVADVLEFLDESGTPRLRMAAPYVVDAAGRHEARTHVDGCAYDHDPAGPWGRPVTPPGRAACRLRIAWTGVDYPALVDPAWTATGSMTRVRSEHAATLLPSSGRVLITGGYGGTASAELFDGTSTFAVTGNMTVPRYRHTATYMPSTGKVLITGGGTSGVGTLSSAETFDGVSTFTAVSAMKSERVYHVATLLSSGKVLITGGTSSSAWQATAEVFDGSTFTLTSPMVTARGYHTATLLTSGKVLVAAGYNATGAISLAELFDGTSSFAPTGSCKYTHNGDAAVRMPSGNVLLVGNGAELFDGTSAFAVTGSPVQGRSGHTATLFGATALIAGGSGVASAELFNGSTFSLTGAMTAARTQHTATLLASGTRVLVAGGQSLSTAEVYAQVGAGGTCSVGSDCASGACEDGRCCAAGPCTGTCKTCDATGACVSVLNAEDNTCSGTQKCDAAGACKLKDGQPATVGTSCASGFSSDGVCCNAACSGACDACTTATGATTTGTCATLPKGAAGNPSCAPFLCGGAVGCPTSCASDADCSGTAYCNAAKVCVARKALGAACKLDAGADCAVPGCRACTSGYCTDGVCCDTACKGAGYFCQACAAALKESGTDGTCGPAKKYTNPHADDCPKVPGKPCENDGLCDGKGACNKLASATTTCGSAVCNAAGTGVEGRLCDGTGYCDPTPKTVSCKEYLCKSDACLTKCASDLDCAADHYCNSTVCVPKAADGTPCTSGSQCKSKVCADGVCCNSACSGQCQACDIAPNVGTCTPVPPKGAPRPGHPPCAGAGACAGTCDGVNMATCIYPGATQTCSSVCADGRETVNACDGAGACATTATPRACGAYACNEAKTGCLVKCANDSDCAAGYACRAETCNPVAARCSDDGKSSIGAGSVATSCGDYRCDPATGLCAKACTSTVDCADGFECGSSGRCVPTAPPPPGDCHCHHLGAGGGDSWSAAAALALALVGVRRRQRR